MKTPFPLPATLLLAAAPLAAAHLTPAAERAFDAYIARFEAARPAPQAGPGIQPIDGGTWSVPGGLIHHWRAAAVVPGVRARDMLTLVRDYNNLSRYYAPEVVSSRALAATPDSATVVMRFRRRQIVTVVLDAEFDCRSALTAPDRGFSISRSTHIWEVADPGTPSEHRRPEGHDNGYLWRLNSYWAFRETPAGLLIQCDAISLTRDVPTGLGWLILPIVQTLPRASLEFTLIATENALTRKEPKA